MLFRSVNAADPLYFDGKLFITSGYGRGCALIDISGPAAKLVWENNKKPMASHFCSPVYIDGNIYGIDGNTGGGKLQCLDPKTGDIKWSQGGGFETFCAAAGKIIALDGRGDLIVAEAVPTGYKELARASVLNNDRNIKKWTAPVLANGLIYCRDGDGELVCVDVR